jgi:hypothetical protein
MSRRCCALLFLVSVLAVPAPARAQIDDTSWGITAGVTPRWTIPATVLASVFDASRLDVRGPEFRLGIIRGTTLGGEWGVSLVHKRLSKQSTLELEGTGQMLTVVAEDAELLGVEAHRFFAFARPGRVQVGLLVGGGIAQLRGFVTGAYVGSTPTTFVIGFPEAFTVTGREIDWLPLARAEVGVVTPVGERLKVRVSGGFNMPGFQVVSVSLSYLLGQDK